MKKSVILFCLLFLPLAVLAQPVPYLSYPVGGAAVYTTTPELNWYITSSGSGILYNLQVSEDTSFNILAYQADDINSTSHTITEELTPGTTYYWQVRTKTTSPEAYGEFSDFESFTVNTAGYEAPVPYLSYPVGGATVYTNYPKLYWYVTTSGADHYDVQVSDDTTFSNIVDSESIIEELSYTVDPLEPGKTYYWRVRSYNDNSAEHSQYSDYESFVIDDAGSETPVPYLSYPVGGATVYTSYPVLYWYITSSGTNLKYHVQVDADTSFTTLVVDEDMLDSLKHTVLTELDGGVTYYWRVRSYNTVTTTYSAFSDYESFVTDAAGYVPPIPYLSYPVGGATVYTSYPVLNWYVTAPGADHFDLEVDDDSSFNSLEIEELFLDSLKYTVSTQLTGGTTYYWRVRSYNENSGDHTSYTDFESFVINSSLGSINPPEAPYLKSPDDEETGLAMPFDLTWGIFEEDPVTYHLQVSTSNAFTTTVINADDYNDSTLTFFGISGETYYWRVQAKNSSGVYSAYSSIRQFTTQPDPVSPTVVPLLGNPVAGMKVAEPVLSWYLPIPFDKPVYKIQISDTKDFSNILIEEDNLKEQVYKINSLTPGAVYYWRVRSQNSLGAVSNYSQTETFRYGNNSTTDVEKQSVLPSEFTVMQNYPNPFNPSTVISFAIPEREFVTIKIYDVLGREIKNLFSGELEPGIHNHVWNGDNQAGQKVSSGTYLYRITAGNNSRVFKMMLMQ